MPTPAIVDPVNFRLATRTNGEDRPLQITITGDRFAQLPSQVCSWALGARARAPMTRGNDSRCSGPLSDLAAMRRAFGAWNDHDLDGAAWVDQLRSGSRLEGDRS